MNTTDKSKEAKMKRFEEEEDKGKPICSLSNFSTVAVSKSMKSLIFVLYIVLIVHIVYFCDHMHTHAHTHTHTHTHTPISLSPISC